MSPRPEARPRSADPGPAVVCVPARDEAERLPRLLRSLAEQRGPAAGEPLRVVVVANNCRDGTAEAVRALQAEGGLSALALRLIEAEWTPPDAHVGTARRAALDAGAAWLAADGVPEGVLLTTDADAVLPPDWVAANRAALRAAEVVGGRLVIDGRASRDPALADLDARIARYWSCVRAVEDRFDPPPHDPPPRHGDHTGASLGLRASLYRAVGGLPPLPRGEDNALVARVQEAGGRLRHCPRVSVRVSDRAEGRAEGGMAREMARRAAVVRGEEAYALPAPSHWQALVRRRAGLRRVWREARARAPDHLRAAGLDAADIAALAPEDCTNDIAFVARASRLLEARDAAAPLVALDAALADFEALVGHGGG